MQHFPHQFSVPNQQVLMDIFELLQSRGNYQTKDLPELALIYGTSVQTLRRNFKTLYGRGLREFMLEQRMKKAFELVTTTDMSLEAIAGELKYTEIFSLVRAFKNKYGVHPRELRKRAG